MKRRKENIQDVVTSVPTGGLVIMNDPAKPYSVNITVENLLKTGGLSKEYKAILTASIVSTTSGLLEIGKTYTIKEVLLTDDFTNVGFVAINTPFVATGTTPTVWTNSTIVYNLSDSTISANALLNTTGVTPKWSLENTDEIKVTSAALFTANKTFVHPFVIEKDINTAYCGGIVFDGTNGISFLNAISNEGDKIHVYFEIFP